MAALRVWVERRVWFSFFVSSSLRRRARTDSGVGAFWGRGNWRFCEIELLVGRNWVHEVDYAMGVSSWGR